VNTAAFSFDQAALFKPIDQFDCAVMTNAESIGKIFDARFHAFGQALQGKQQLILSRPQTGGLGRLITECKIPPDLIPEFCECLIIRLCDVVCV
jgi:hypothetical protein